MTMTDPGSAGPLPGSGSVTPVPTPPPAAGPPAGPGPGGGAPPPRRWLRRSRNDRMISGVAGGLGEYFGVDPVIFRVLFAVLSFFGGVGLLMYGLAWLLVPEPDVDVSALDKAIGQLRLRRVPPWLVFIGGAIVLWIGWFSWWAPGPTFPALMLLAVLMLVLVHRLERSAARDAGTATAPPTVTASEIGEVPLIAPLNDTRRSMQAWLSEASAAHRERIRRRRPIKVGVAVCLAIAWSVVALLDAFTRVPFPVYLWVGLAVLGTGFLLSLVTGRLTLSLLAPIAVLAVIALALGGTRASLSDGSGKIGWQPTSVSQLADQRQFAGQSTLDLTQLDAVDSARVIHLRQAVGELLLRLPATLNATVIADVHLGDVQYGRSHDTGQYVSGQNVHLELPPPAGATGAPVTIYLDLTVGHVQLDRVTG